MQDTSWEIRPPDPSPVACLRDMWHGRALFRFFAREALKWTYRRTSLGAVWMIALPLMTVALHLVFFVLILKLDTDLPLSVYYLSGMVIWVTFDQGIVWSARSLETQRKLISKIYFPRMILPIAFMLPAAVDFLVLIAVLFAFTTFLFFRTGIMWIELSLDTLWTIPILGLTILFALGVGLWLAPATIRSRDMLYTMRYALGALFLLTPVAYPLESYTGALAWLPIINPMAQIVVQFRNAMTAPSVEPGYLLYPMAVALITLASGYINFIVTDARTVDRI